MKKSNLKSVLFAKSMTLEIIHIRLTRPHNSLNIGLYILKCKGTFEFVECDQFANGQVLSKQLSGRAQTSFAGDSTYLVVKPLDPALQIVDLVGGQITAVVQGSIKILGQHLLVEALTGQAAGGISAGEILVGAAGAVEVPAGRHVVNLSLHRQVDGGVILAVVLEQGARGESPEDDGGRRFREGHVGVR